LVIIWATRLGLFLVRRVFKHGKDRRLDAIKVRPLRFLITWTIQGESDANGVADDFADNNLATWISIASLPVWAVGYLHFTFFRLLSGVIQANSLPPEAHPPIDLNDFIGFTLFLFSFMFEVFADYQKSLWRHQKDIGMHSQKFISGGLWSISR
jgi:steroid 5-alpha reductase family enzyme